MKYKSSVWQPFNKENYHWAWRDKKLIGVIKEFVHDIKRCHDRIYKGYCDHDVWSIDRWFLKIMPTMLRELRDTTNGYPDSVENSSHAISIDEMDKINDGMKAWKKELSRIVFLLQEADEDLCRRKNPYQAEYDKAQKKFERKYGMFGEKLLTKKEKIDSRSGKGKRMYTISDVPEFKSISDRYFDEERKLSKYRSKCKDKAMKLFSKWFYDLWD